MNSNPFAFRLRCAGTVLALAAGLAGMAGAAAAQQDQLFEQAVASYRQERFSESFGRFLTLARSGDADAARIVLFMNQYGPRLYGKYWDLNGDEIADFNRLASGRLQRPHPEYRPPWEAVPVSTHPQRARGAGAAKIAAAR